jgi:hypothetical protein
MEAALEKSNTTETYRAAEIICQGPGCIWIGCLEDARRGYATDGQGDVYGTFFCPACGAEL